MQEIREAHRRLGMHTRLGKVWRLENLHEPCRKMTGYQGSSYSVKFLLTVLVRDHKSIALSFYNELF